VPDIVLDYLRLKTPADVWSYTPRTITGLELREDSLLWEVLRGAAVALVREEDIHLHGLAFPTVYTDKAISGRMGDASAYQTGYYGGLIGRGQPWGGGYLVRVLSGARTQDFSLQRDTIPLASEAVDLTAAALRTVMISCSGSTIKAFRVDMTTPKLIATDTTYASGYFGICPRLDYNDARSLLGFIDMLITARLRAAASAMPSALAILELYVEGSGRPEDPYRPAFSTSPSKHPVYGDVDLDSVTWGAFEFYPDKASTVIVTVTGDNPYKPGAIGRQRAKAKRAFKVPKDYGEAVALYNQLKKDYSHWLAGKDNFAYQVLGWEFLDWMQNIDFYHGELIEHKTHYDQLKMVPDWEIRNRLSELIERLTKVTVLTDERDKHIAKAKEILKRGW
jgi:hypothetical protein